MNQLILVADDDARNVKLIVDLLTFKNFPVIQALNGREALELAKSRKPGLILMDIQMPVLDGFVVVQMLKSDPETAGIPVWALTSYAMPGDDRRICEAGCDLYISKPLDVRAFLALVEKHFAERQPPELLGSDLSPDSPPVAQGGILHGATP